MSTATLTFTLPEEAEEHAAAIDGARWRAVVLALDEALRQEVKHGPSKHVDRAAWARAALREAVEAEGLAL